MLHIWKNIGVHSSTGVQLLFFFNHYVLKAKGCLFSSWSKSNLLFRNLYLWFWLHLNYLCFDSQDMAPNSEDLYLEYKSCLQDILFNLTWTSSSLSLFKSSAVLILLVWNSDMVFLGVSQNASEQTFHSQFFFYLVMFYTSTQTLEAIICYVGEQGCKHMLMWERVWHLKQEKPQNSTIYLKCESTQAINQTVNN